jgi:hypothetical protein
MTQKVDKIFNNTFESSEFELNGSISFEVSKQYSDDRSEDEKIELEMIRRDIHSAILNSRFKHFNDLDDMHDTKKLKKIDINEVYEFIVGELVKKYSLIELFSETCEYFNVHPTKFYSSLGNKFKEDLIQELDTRTNILKRKKINRLF